MLTAAQDLQKKGYEKVAITWPTTVKQADAILKKDMLLAAADLDVAGSTSQDRVMQEMQKLLADDAGEFKDLKKVLRIIPVVTQEKLTMDAQTKTAEQGLEKAKKLLQDGAAILNWQHLGERTDVAAFKTLNEQHAKAIRDDLASLGSTTNDPKP